VELKRSGNESIEKMASVPLQIGPPPLSFRFIGMGSAIRVDQSNINHPLTAFRWPECRGPNAPAGRR